ncbi:MAG: biotin-dependent carboxyltransferase family protein [Ilumatobacteraceae bacterium]
MTLIVEQVGFTTVQDLGRVGWAHLGVSPSGAADRTSLQLANRLLGNSSAAATLETPGGLALLAAAETAVVLTGAECNACLDGKAVAHCQPFVMPAGSLLRIPTVRNGVWTYIGIAGGIEGPERLGSRSHDTMGNIVPLPLHAGITLHPGLARGTTLGLDTPIVPSDTERLTVDVGPHMNLVGNDVCVRAFRRTWSVSGEPNRVGVRLTGPSLHPRHSEELHSFPLVRGAIQLTPADELVVMLADHPTTGGYPVVGVVSPRDVDRLAQARTGSRVTWKLAVT